MKYKELRLKTTQDLKRAESYQSRGWKVICYGINSVLMEKKEKKGRKNKFTWPVLL